MQMPQRITPKNRDYDDFPTASPACSSSGSHYIYLAKDGLFIAEALELKASCLPFVVKVTA